MHVFNRNGLRHRDVARSVFLRRTNVEHNDGPGANAIQELMLRYGLELIARRQILPDDPLHFREATFRYRATIRMSLNTSASASS